MKRTDDNDSRKKGIFSINPFRRATRSSAAAEMPFTTTAAPSTVASPPPPTVSSASYSPPQQQQVELAPPTVGGTSRLAQLIKDLGTAEDYFNRFGALHAKAVEDKERAERAKQLREERDLWRAERDRLEAKIAKLKGEMSSSSPVAALTLRELDVHSKSMAFDFVTHNTFNILVEKTISNINEWPTSQKRDITLCGVRGMMGSGKTRTVWECAKRVQNDARLREGGVLVHYAYVRIEELSAELEGGMNELQPSSCVCAALCYGMGAKVDRRNPPDFTTVREALCRMAPTLGDGRTPLKRVVILHLDEYQANPDLVVKIRDGSFQTITESNGFYVLPILSGILDFDRPSTTVMVPVATSQVGWLGLAISPFTGEKLDELEKAFVRSLENRDIQWETYQGEGSMERLKLLFKYCGGRPHIVARLSAAIKNGSRVKFDENKNDLVEDSAKNILEATINGLRTVYGAARWYPLVMGTTMAPPNVESRLSYNSIVKKVIERVLLDATVGAVVMQNTEMVFTGASTTGRDKHVSIIYAKCNDTGMVDLIATRVAGLFRVDISLIQFLCLEEMVSVEPVSDGNTDRVLPVEVLEVLRNPFAQNWMTNEMLAMASLFVRVRHRQELGDTEKWVPMEVLRPSMFALFEKAEPVSSRLEVQIPRELHFRKAARMTEEEDTASLDVGDFVLCAENQQAIDGFAIFRTRVVRGGAASRNEVNAVADTSSPQEAVPGPVETTALVTQAKFSEAEANLTPGQFEEFVSKVENFSNLHIKPKLSDTSTPFRLIAEVFADRDASPMLRTNVLGKQGSRDDLLAEGSTAVSRESLSEAAGPILIIPHRGRRKRSYAAANLGGGEEGRS